MRKLVLLLFPVVLAFACACPAADYFINAETGSDESAGTSEATAWKSLRRVNETQFKPGDRVLFSCGQVWRGTLQMQTGEAGRPITFASYGTGLKPRILGSVSLNDPHCWVPAGKNLWKTEADTVQYSETGAAIPFAKKLNDWFLYVEKPAQAKVETSKNEQGERVFKISCTDPGETTSRIQFSNQPFSVKSGESFALKFRARSSVPYSLPLVSMMKAGRPWTGYGDVLANTPNRRLELTDQWSEYELILSPGQTAQDARFTFFLGKDLPKGCVLEFVPLSVRAASVKSLGLTADVGNVILHVKGQKDKIAGFKRWSLADLKEQGDYFSDPLSTTGGSRVLYFYSKKNPTEVYQSIEAAIRKPTATMGNQGWFVLDGLALGNTAAHGINGGNVHDAIIRNCDFFWIGGGHLYTRGPIPTRYGNGIEFWSGNRDILVENCRFWQIYDTAMTNQGPDDGELKNMIWRGNTIWLCEQAYEIWLTGKNMTVDNLVFENNAAYDSGYGWGHVQRPNKNGTPLLSYNILVKSLKITYRNNKFLNGANTMVWFYNNWIEKPEYDINHNIYWQETANPQNLPLFKWPNAKEGVSFREYQKRTGKDADSRWEKIDRIEYFDYE